MTEKKATPPKVGRAGSKVSKKNNNCKPKRPQEKIQRSSQQGEQKPSEEEKNYFLRLVAATTSDPGAPFAPDALGRLKKLRLTDCPEFERVRAQLKIAGCRMTALDRALDGGDQSHVLIKLAQTGAQLYRTPH